MGKKPIKIKLALILVLGISLGALCWYFLKFQMNQSPVQLPLPATAAKALMALSQVRQTATKDGVVQWKLAAQTAELEAETGRMILRNPKIDFFMKDGSKLHMTATKGVLNTRNNNMEVQGHVLLRSDRYTLQTEELVYDHDIRLITTHAPVQINSLAIQLHAAGMTYDLTTDQAQFRGPVQGVLHENPVM
jgi:lipopolysaccharide export system protein LptC